MGECGEEIQQHCFSSYVPKYLPSHCPIEKKFVNKQEILCVYKLCNVKYTSKITNNTKFGLLPCGEED